ncbi:MAG: hypothetical protein LBM69_08090 [Lachnospiraceae bacterium]|jgi:hypothetical protein|nr:hypothetical protein [Lachnospiraceae bacterium]
MEYERRALPFYMSYPGPQSVRPNESVIRDLEYLHQTYPNEVRKYQLRVAEILDKMDYEGSMIYDEYPDRCSLQHLAKSITGILEQEETRKMPSSKSADEWKWMENLVQVLLCNEIYKRRHGGRRRFVTF